MSWKYSTVNTSHKWVGLDDDVIALYNHNDCLATALLMRKAPEILAEHNNFEFWKNQVKPLIPAAMDMQMRGLPVDLEVRKAHQERLRTVRAECDQTIFEFAASHGMDGFNINSPVQKADLLYKRIGFKPRKNKGKISTDQSALLSIWNGLLKREEDLRPLLEALLHRSRVNTILIRYLNFPVDPDSVVRPTIKMFGTKTMRYAYESPPLQQWVKEIRNIIHAPDGYVFISADYRALEARILAYQFNDTRDIECFEKGWDLHLVTANDLFDLGIGEKFETLDSSGWDELAKTAAQERLPSKNYRFGKAYGGSAASMKTKSFCPCNRWGCDTELPPTLDRNKMIAAEFAWNQQHKDYEDNIAGIIRRVRETKTYVSPFGLTRYFTKPFGSELRPGEAERELRNFFGQHPAAMIINGSQRLAYEAGLPICLQMHDALSMICLESEADARVETLRAIMERPIPELNNISFPVDIEIGQTWK